MKKLIFVVLLNLFASQASYSQEEAQSADLQERILQLSDTCKSIFENLGQLKSSNDRQDRQTRKLESRIKALEDSAKEMQKVFGDSVSNLDNRMQSQMQNHHKSLRGDIEQAQSSLTNSLQKMDLRIMWGGGLLLLFILVLIGYLYVRRRADYASMHEVRKAQDALQAAQTRLQEDAVRLDNQMISLIERQMNARQTIQTADTDHSLALKVADEIVRIELNISRMDSSIKGYKQLRKAVERIKNNFQANGYEIVDMLGKPYSEGMKVVASFVPDETLQEGEQIITGIIKPQINYNGKMIQSAQITVSQNI